MFLHWTCVSPERHQRLHAICEHASHLRDICDYMLCVCETVSFRYVKYLLMLCSVFKEHVLITEVIRSLCEHVIFLQITCIYLKLCIVLWALHHSPANCCIKVKYCVLKIFATLRGALFFVYALNIRFNGKWQVYVKEMLMFWLCVMPECPSPSRGLPNELGESIQVGIYWS